MTTRQRSILLKKRWEEINRQILSQPQTVKRTKGITAQQALQEWFDWATTARSPESVALMRLAADRLANTLRKKRLQGALGDVTLRQIDRWVGAMHKRTLAPTTINLRIRIINAFLVGLLSVGCSTNPLAFEQISQQQKLPKTLTPDQTQALFERIARLAQHDAGPAP